MCISRLIDVDSLEASKQRKNKIINYFDAIIRNLLLLHIRRTITNDIFRFFYFFQIRFIQWALLRISSEMGD